jgi:4-diphosphocytidyl-2-C-methyl-D-erythritol kinase
MREVTVRAPAKINLGLEVLGKRPDGYHELLTVLQTIELADTVRIRLTDPSSTILTGPPSITLTVRFSGTDEVDLGPHGQNLVLRAARAYLEAMPERGSRRLEISLTKRIPVGAGLGGGSTDAAATLLGLNELLGALHPDPEQHRRRLHALATSLGMDVAFFLEGGSQLGTGRGECVVPIDPWPGRALVIVYPNVSLPTSSIYGRLRLPLTPSGPLATMAPRENPSALWDRAWRDLRNDLQDVVVEQVPAVGMVLDELQALGAVFARVTGSGSAVFALASSDDEAAGWSGRFRSSGYWARATRPSQCGCRLLRRARS